MNETCCACSGKQTAVVQDGCRRKPVCAQHALSYARKGYQIYPMH